MTVAQKPLLEAERRAGTLALVASGPWTAEYAAELEALIDGAATRADLPPQVEVDLNQVASLDTYGAWLVERLTRDWLSRGVQPRIMGLGENYLGLVQDLRKVNRVELPEAPHVRPWMRFLDTLGRNVVEAGGVFSDLANMLGAIAVATARVARRPRSFRLTSLVNQLDRVCWRAVPIILLITFLIGCILAQQGIFHFRRFGADVYVVDMVGVLVLREVGVLIVAIMVAGRSGSSYTAELGSMKMREEIDALRTMGFDPVEVLILPRVFALLIGLPLLAFIGSMAAMYGGGLVAWIYGGMQPEVFLARLRDVISIDHFQVGMIKAPFMAAVIGLVSCVEGLQVGGSAESLGARTTSSVVKSIFFVIVMDGVFAMFFAAIGK